MPRFAAKIIFGLAAVPFLMGIFVLIVMLFGGGLLGVCVADFVCGALAIGGWIGLWRSTVVWTHDRIVHTALAAILSVLVGSGIGVFATIFSGIPEEAAIVGGLFGGGCWVLLSTWCWRQTPQERVAAARGAASDEPIGCPMCGYNLAGLYEARCPECGTRYTIEELLRTTRRPTDVDESLTTGR